MGIALLDALEASEKAEFRLRIETARSAAALALYQEVTHAWYRQWWVILPLGLAAGAAITLGVTLATH